MRPPRNQRHADIDIVQHSEPESTFIGRSTGRGNCRLRMTEVKSRKIVIPACLERHTSPIVVKIHCDVIFTSSHNLDVMRYSRKALRRRDRHVPIPREIRPSLYLFLSPVVKCFPSDTSSRQRIFRWRRLTSHRYVYVFRPPSTSLYVILRSSPMYRWLDCACAR